MTALLEAQGLTMRFGGVTAVDGVSLAIQEQELRCLIGPNGAGKSTLFRCLTGQERPSSGRILWRGRDITGWTIAARARLGIGIKTQVPQLFDGLSVMEGVVLALRRSQGEAVARRRAGAVLERLGIAGLAGRLAGSLAHGQRQLAELALVTAAEPALIILDEPTAGMGAEETARTAGLILELNLRAAIIVVEHDMGFIRRLGGRTTVLHQGRILVEGGTEEVLRDARVRDVYLGRPA